jgi:hypothetical protein
MGFTVNEPIRKEFYRTKPLWGSTATWKTVNRNIAALIRLHHPEMDRAVALARNVQIRLESVFSILDDLCAVTCPWCPDHCCLVAKVWIDFKDLLFLHLNGRQIPAAQPLSHLKETCRYWSPKGCTLPRIARPWVCTWYLCPTQKANLRQKPKSVQDNLSRAVQAIKTARKQMESEFIRIVS